MTSERNRMIEDRRAHERIEKMDYSIKELDKIMVEHTIYIREISELQRKNSDDIDILKDDLRENKEFNKRTAYASEDSSKDLKELISIFKGSKNMAASIKYFGILFTTISFVIGSLFTIWNYGGEIINFILHKVK